VAHAGADNAELKRLKEEFVPRLKEAPASERQAILTEVIGQQIVRVMGLDPSEQIDPNQPLQELGLDSLMAVELRNILCAISGRQLAATLLFKYPTVASLSAFLIKDMFGEDADEGATDAAAPVAAAAAVPEEDFSELSEDELADLLAKELTADTE
jgi:acyl carrier protein